MFVRTLATPAPAAAPAVPVRATPRRRCETCTQVTMQDPCGICGAPWANGEPAPEQAVA